MRFLACLFFAMLLTLNGCATKSKDDYRYIKDALVINLNATDDLNTFNNQSHTVVLALYELSNPNIFNQMLEAPEGVVQLLEGKQFDESVLSRRKLVIQPGENKEFRIDRVEGARYLGVVAGFYSMQGSGNFSRIFPINLSSGPSYFWTKTEEPRKTIELTLGSDGFMDVKKKQK